MSEAAWSDAEAAAVLAAARAGEGLEPLLAGRSAGFLRWLSHHPRYGVFVADVWADLLAGGACAKPAEAARAVLAALADEGWLEQPQEGSA